MSSIETSSPSRNLEYNNAAGILDIKLKKRFQQNHALTIHNNQSNELNSKKSRSKHLSTSPVRRSRVEIPSLRSPTYETRCDEIMNRLHFSGPIRSIVHREIEHEKEEEAKLILPKIRSSSLPSSPKKMILKSKFPVAYSRGELPVMIEHKANGLKIKWTRPVEELDYSHVLPMFLEGFVETNFPFTFLASEGASDLVEYGMKYPAKVHACLHLLIEPLRTALNSRHTTIFTNTLTFLKKLLKIQGVGAALLPYYRQLLPSFNYFKDRRINIGDAIDYGQRKNHDLCALIQETLELLEMTAGPDGYVNIKYMIPTYERYQSTTKKQEKKN